MPRSNIRKLASVALLFAVSGCVSVLPEPNVADALYRIDAQADGPELASSVTIREPEAPRIFAGTAMVSEDATGALRLVRGVEWAGPATRQFQLALIDSFSQAGASAVLPEAGIATNYEVSSRLATFGFVRDQAVCTVSVDLVDMSKRTSVKSGTITATAPLDEGVASSRAQVMKSVAQQCVAKVSEFIASNEANGNSA